jgi:hypothetical protein
MRKIKLNPPHILRNNLCCTCLLAPRVLKSGTILYSWILMSCSALSEFRYLPLAAAYLENAVSHTYVEGNGSTVVTILFTS